MSSSSPGVKYFAAVLSLLLPPGLQGGAPEEPLQPPPPPPQQQPPPPPHSSNGEDYGDGDGAGVGAGGSGEGLSDGAADYGGALPPLPEECGADKHPVVVLRSVYTREESDADPNFFDDLEVCVFYAFVCALLIASPR